MTLAGLIAAAKVFGIQAVTWVIANQGWLLPLGSAAISIIRKMFG